MEIYCYMNQKQTEALKGENTGINFPYLNKIKRNPYIDLISNIFKSK